jgi:hypothetical protein
MAPTDPDLSTFFHQLLRADVVPFHINWLSFSGLASCRRFGLRPNHQICHWQKKNKQRREKAEKLDRSKKD